MDNDANSGGAAGDPQSELNRGGEARKALLQQILDLTGEATMLKILGWIILIIFIIGLLVVVGFFKLIF